MPIRTAYDISSTITPDRRGGYRTAASDGTLTIRGPGMQTEACAGEFVQAVKLALRPFRLRPGGFQPYEGVMTVDGCTTEFQVRTAGHDWIVQDDNGTDHRSRSLRTALRAGVRAMALAAGR
jgi:hypothetical protein